MALRDGLIDSHATRPAATAHIHGQPCGVRQGRRCSTGAGSGDPNALSVTGEEVGTYGKITTALVDHCNIEITGNAIRPVKPDQQVLNTGLTAKSSAPFGAKKMRISGR